MRNIQNDFGNKTIEKMQGQYLHKNIIMKEFASQVEKSEEFIHYIYEVPGSRSITESIHSVSLLVTYDINTSYYFEKHSIKMLLWNVNAFAKKIVLYFKIDETKLRTSNLILKKKVKQCIIELSITKLLLCSSFGNWL